MKKIFSLILVVAMLSTVCMAASVGLDSTTVSSDGTSAIDVVFKVSEDFSTAYSTCLVYYNAEAWTLSNLGSDISGASVVDNAAAGFVDFSIVAPASATKGSAFIKFTATPKAGVDVVGETFSLRTLTILDETGMGVIEDGTGADIVLTVEAAAQDETVTGTATTDAKRELLLGGTYYTNLAVFDAAIPLVPTKNAKEIGWTLSAPEKADKVIKYTPQTAISGQGSIVFAAIVYNVPSEVTITATPYVVYGN